MSSIEENNFNFYNLQSYCNKLGLVYDGEWFRWLKDIVGTKISMFSYDNLPDSLTSNIVEQALLFRHNLCFAYIGSLDKVCLCRYINGSAFDIYWKPVYVNLLSLSGKTIATRVPYNDIVLVRDNPLDIIPFLTLNSWINKIIEMEKTLGINVQLMRLPTLFACDKKLEGSLKALFKKINDFQPFVIGDSKLMSGITPIKFDLPCSLDDLYNLIDKYKSLALASIGIYSSDTKRERLITAEITASNDFSDMIYQSMLDERERWVKEVNEKFGLNIQLVELYRKLKEDDTEIEVENVRQVEEATAKAQNLVEEGSNNAKQDE